MTFCAIVATLSHNLLFAPMKPLSTRTIAIIALVAVAVLAIGVFAIQDHTKAPTPVVGNGEGLENQESQGGNMENEEELVWYEIPELGIEFQIDKKIESDIVYNFKSTSLGVEEDVVNFDIVTFYSLSFDKICREQVASISKFEGAPSHPLGGSWANTEDEIAKGNMIVFDDNFILGRFSYEVENPYSCLYPKLSYEEYMKWLSLSQNIKETFHVSVREMN